MDTALRGSSVLHGRMELQPRGRTGDLMSARVVMKDCKDAIGEQNHQRRVTFDRRLIAQHSRDLVHIKWLVFFILQKSHVCSFCALTLVQRGFKRKISKEFLLRVSAKCSECAWTGG